MSLESTMSSPTPLSFACAEEIFGNLAVQHTAQLVANASDITLITDNHGVIRDLAFQSPSLFDEVGRGWVDQKMVDVVTSECVNKVEELLGAAQDGHEVRAREINHLTKDGSNLPMQYWAMRLGDGDMIVVFGMDISRISDLQQKLMNSQLSVEREFAQLRSAESHYRMMFQLSDTPQIVVDATSLRVSDINETATRLFGRTHQQIGDMKKMIWAEIKKNEKKEPQEEELVVVCKAHPLSDEIKISASELPGRVVITRRRRAPPGVTGNGADGVYLKAGINMRGKCSFSKCQVIHVYLAP